MAEGCGDVALAVFLRFLTELGLVAFLRFLVVVATPSTWTRFRLLSGHSSDVIIKCVELPHLQWVLFFRFLLAGGCSGCFGRIASSLFFFSAFCWMRSSIAGIILVCTCVFQHAMHLTGRVTLADQSAWSCGKADRCVNCLPHSRQRVLWTSMLTGGGAS